MSAGTIGSGGEDVFSLWCMRVVESGLVRGDGEEIVFFLGAGGCGEYESVQCSIALIGFFEEWMVQGFTDLGVGDYLEMVSGDGIRMSWIVTM